MKIYSTFLIILILIVLLLTPSILAGGRHFYNGNQLVELSGIHNNGKDDKLMQYMQYMGYVSGVFDATSHLYSTGDGLEIGQICTIVTNYLNAHPEKWNESAYALVVAALQKAFPLSTNNKLHK